MKNIKVLGCPFSFGQPHKDVDRSPEVLRQSGFMDELSQIAPVIDLGDLDFSLCHKHFPSENIKNAGQNSLANELLSHCIEGEDLSESFLLNIGGDHGMGLGTVHGMLTKDPETVVVWADAHGDINTPSSSHSKNFHGMPLAFLMKVARNAELFPWIKRTLLSRKLIMVGPRDLDPAEKEVIEDLQIVYFSSFEMNKYGTRHLLKKALLQVDPKESSPIHLSFDVDLFDAGDLVSTGTRVKEGPYMAEVFNLGRTLGETGRLKSMDIVELNPSLGYLSEVQRTFDLAKKFTLCTIKYALSESKKDSYLPHAQPQTQSLEIIQ